MQKRYLLAPGPTAIPPEALLVMDEPMLHLECTLSDLGYKFNMGTGVAKVPDILKEL